MSERLRRRIRRVAPWWRRFKRNGYIQPRKHNEAPERGVKSA